MGPYWFRHHPAMLATWWLADALWVIPEIVLSLRLRSSADAQKLDRGSKAAVVWSVWLGVWAGFAATYMLPRFAMGHLWRSMFAAGIALWLAGVAFRLYAMRVLGKFFTYDVAISSGQHVIQAGPYRWIRHPSYLGSLATMLGFGMTMTNWAAMVIPVVVLALGFAYRIPLEERALAAGLGDEYRQYMRRSWRLVPFLF